MRSRMVGSAGMATAPDHGGWGDGSPLRPLPTDVHDRRSRPARPGHPHRPPRRGGARPGPRHLHRAADRGRRHQGRPRHRRDPRGRAVALLDHLLLAAGARPLARRGTRRGKLTSARSLPRLLGRRLGRARLLLDAWFMRARLIEAALADGHTVIGRVRRDLALYAVPRPPRRRRRGRPRKYGARMTRARIEALPVHRSARILYGKLEVVRYRTRPVAARFLKGRVVRAVWVELERPDRRDTPGRGAAP